MLGESEMIKVISTSRISLYNHVVSSLEDLGFKEVGKDKWFFKGENANKIFTFISDLQGRFDMKSVPGQLTFTSNMGLKVIITKSLTGTMVDIK